MLIASLLYLYEDTGKFNDTLTPETKKSLAELHPRNPCRQAVVTTV